MSTLFQNTPGTRLLMMGNDAIARGAVEAGITVAAGYPGTPSSEIIERLSRHPGIRSEWSVNEKVALEVAAAGSFAGQRSLAVMKQPGVNVAADFLMHLALSGVRGGMVLVSADDPGALSSVNEGDTRFYARLMEVPLLEPGDFQEAKEMTRWAFDLSEDLGILVLLRTVTRLSHASGNVVLGETAAPAGRPVFRFDNDNMLDPLEGLQMSTPVGRKRSLQHRRLEEAEKRFESSPFNTYDGPDSPELLIITSSICSLYSREAVAALDLGTRVGILKLGTTWPLPRKLLKKRLAATPKVLFVEEVQPFVEESVKAMAADLGSRKLLPEFLGKHSGHIPMRNEMNPDLVIEALAGIFGLTWQPVPGDYQALVREAAAGVPAREISFCPGCPHRASYFSINRVLQLDNRKGFTCGDIGCYSLGMLQGGYFTLKTLHSMGSGAGLASGFGSLSALGMDQPVLAVCGDSTFFHAAMPPLVNAIHTGSRFTLVVLDNSGTAMTGFQPHPGLPVDIGGNAAPAMDIAAICRAMGAETVIRDPFDLEKTQETILDLIDRESGVQVLILRRLCALSPERKRTRAFDMAVDPDLCMGEDCGCNRLCTRVFACPGLIWDTGAKKARINEFICTGCGVCASVCPAGAISRKEVRP